MEVPVDSIFRYKVTQFCQTAIDCQHLFANHESFQLPAGWVRFFSLSPWKVFAKAKSWVFLHISFSHCASQELSWQKLMVVIAQTGVGVIVNLVDGPWFLGSDKCISYCKIPFTQSSKVRGWIFESTWLRLFLAESWRVKTVAALPLYFQWHLVTSIHLSQWQGLWCKKAMRYTISAVNRWEKLLKIQVRCSIVTSKLNQSSL